MRCLPHCGYNYTNHIFFSKVRYKNFLSTGNIFTEIDLGEHATTLIIGENGAGKSTFLDAITFALFGKPFRNINKPQLVNSINEKDCVVEVYQQMSDGSLGNLIESYKDFGARDSVMRMFENTGLGDAFIKSLMDTIDKVYEENIMPTDEQVLNTIYTSDAYKTRFA